MKYDISALPKDKYGEIFYKACIEGRRDFYKKYTKAEGETIVDEVKWTFFGGYDAVTFGTFEAARDYARKMGFIVPDSALTPTRYTNIRIDIEHPEAKELIRITDDIQAQLEATAKRVFVRFGTLPNSGRSYNYRDNKYESGISVFNALLLHNGQVIVKPNTNYELGSLFTLMDRDAYIVEGEVIGTGSDGEPLLRNAKIVRKLKSSDFYKFDRIKLLESLE